MVRKIDRRRRFAQEYVIDLNGTRSAIAAGYAPDSAAVESSRLLSDVKTRQYIDTLLAARASKLGVKAEHVLEEITRLANSNVLDFVTFDASGQPTIDLSKADRDKMAAVQEIKIDEYAGGTGDGERRQVIRTTFKLHPKDKALDMLMRHLGAYNDKLKVTGLEGLAEVIEKARRRAAR